MGLNPARATVIVPAHNEEAVIARTLGCVLDQDSDLKVLVVCNGCSDRTARVVREKFPDVGVIELSEASKIGAINVGLTMAEPGPVLLLDADIDLPAPAARALLSAVTEPGIEAAIGFMDVDTDGAVWPVRAFYSVWMEHPYLRGGKFAAAIALSAAGRERVGILPRFTADDTYLASLFPRDRVRVVSEARFLARAPRTLDALIRVRTRSHRGNRQLAKNPDTSPRRHAAPSLFRRLLARPSLWHAVPVYLIVTLLARVRARVQPSTGWERDQTTRSVAGAEQH